MKILSFVLLLAASIAFLLLGCSDNSGPIVAPRDQSAPLNEQSPLAKIIVAKFTGNEYPTGLISSGVWTIEHGKTIVKGLIATGVWEVDNPLVNGTIEITANLSLDNITGEGLEYGTFKLTPKADVGGGVWEVTWVGYRHKVGVSEWSTDITDVGYGKGGTVQGMKLFAREVIHTTDLEGAKPYTGDVDGIIKLH
jgi:hypothetical protein